MKKMNICHNSKHFLNVLLLIVALLGINTNAWGADCTYETSFSGSPSVSGKGKLNDLTICSFDAPSPNSVVKVSFHIEFNYVFWGAGYSYDIYAGSTKIGSGSVDNGESKDASFSLNSTTATSFVIKQTSGKYTANRTLTVSNIKVTYQYAASLSASDITMDNTPVGGNTTKTITVEYQNSTNSTTLSVEERSDVNNFFTISPTSQSITDCSNTTTFTVKFAPTSAVTNATATYRISGNGATKDVTVTGTSFAVVDPTFTNEIASSYMVDDAVLDLQALWTSNNKTGAITYSFFSYEEEGENNEDGTTPAITDNRWLSLGKAGKVVVKMHQNASTGYNEHDEYHTIRIEKYTPSFTWNSTDKTYYYQSTIPSIFSTTGPNAYTIVSDNEPSAKVVDNTLHIYNVEETANITVTQEENYLWAGKTATYVVTPVELNNHVPFTITSSNYVTPFKHRSEGSFAWDDGVKLGDGGGGFNWDDKYYDIHFTGIPDKLSFDYETTDGLGHTGIEWRVEESSDGTNWGASKWGTQTSGSGTVVLKISMSPS